MGRRIREQDHRTRDRERAGGDLDEEDETDARPADDVGVVVGGEEREIRRDNVRKGEHGQREAEGVEGADACLQGRVDEELDEDAEDAKGGEVEADGGGREAETAVEVDESLGGGGGGRWGGEEEGEDLHEGCVVQGKEEEGYEGGDDGGVVDGAECAGKWGFIGRRGGWWVEKSLLGGILLVCGDGSVF